MVPLIRALACSVSVQHRREHASDVVLLLDVSRRYLALLDGMILPLLLAVAHDVPQLIVHLDRLATLPQVSLIVVVDYAEHVVEGGLRDN